ncbi:hypothetical protein NEHOM01_1078 [Nematocida homosporus]|uniref:uncharacterized protein n=1 Tax=Nematocida homosporus TaxID=1912981 RepID=UPI00221FDB5D|nr:uncharacterized protein NEHOM01_1078 [Nematocida homosporus]KAI5185801.1 hypothetical protein NEHOM01_1078 [Nematocida homosporus]
MIEKTKTKTAKVGLGSEIKRHRTFILILAQIVIITTVVFFLFQRNFKIGKMPAKTRLFSDLLDLMQQIDEEVDDCTRWPTRREKNEAFRSINSIEDLVPIRISEMTAVFRYNGNVSGLFEIVDLRKDWPITKGVIIKRIIVKKENKPEEEAISLLVRHPLLMKTYASHTTYFTNHKKVDQEILWLIMEPVATRITNKEINKNEARIREILRDVLQGLKYLHANRIVHLDLKLQNVMGTGELGAVGTRYKLIDFGFSRQLPEDKLEVVFPGKSYGTFPYKPPEVWQESVHGYAADIWCLGCMALFMADAETAGFFQKRDPIRSGHTKDYTKFKSFLEGSKRLPISADASLELVHFIKMCMFRDRTKRWTVAQLMEHPFIRGVPLSDEQADTVASAYYV